MGMSPATMGQRIPGVINQTLKKKKKEEEEEEDEKRKKGTCFSAFSDEHVEHVDVVAQLRDD